MLSSIVRNEIRIAVRSGRLWPLLAAWAVLALLAAVATLQAQSQAHRERSDAAAAEQRLWEQQGARNPHSAAHFGQYAYKPATPLGALEPGLDPWLGTAIWMEAHYENPSTQRAADDATPLSRFGTLSFGWLLLVLLPLAAVVLGYDRMAEERAQQRLRLHLAGGATAGGLMLGKGLALAVLVALVTAPAWLGAMLVAALADGMRFPDGGARASQWLLGYAGYGVLWVLLTLAVSALARSARQSLAILASAWLLGVLLLPRLAAERAEAAHPSPHAETFWKEVRKAQSEGIDGHSAGDTRAKQLEAETLQRYGVTRKEDLPISFAGVALQASEEYGNEVFERFHGARWDGYAEQARSAARWSWLAPAIAVRQVATAAAATDLEHHRRFAQAAETHRRDLQRFLNDDMTRNAKGKDFEYKAPDALWAAAPRWSYAAPAAVSSVRTAAFVLLAWLIGAGAACVIAARRLPLGAAA